MTGEICVKVAMGVVYVEKVRQDEFVVYRPGTLETCHLARSWEVAIAYARAEWPDLPVVRVREYQVLFMVN
jgi:hypothetical protein